MLEQLRRNSRSFIIWILFGIIITVFIISFGPQAQKTSLSCGHSGEDGLEVAGDAVPTSSWRFALNGLKRSSIPAQLRSQFAADLLVERELLAQAAEERGFRVSDDMVNQAIAAGELYILGYSSRQDTSFWRDYKQLEALASDLGMSNVSQLADEQRREQLAEMMRQVILRGSVSDEELRQVYVNQNTKITAEYVKFDVMRYRSALHLSEADLDRYAASHDAELKKTWEAEKAEWSSAKPRVLVRQILISKAPPPRPADKQPEQGKPADGTKPADGKKADKADKPEAVADATPPAEQAKKVRARLVGGASFADVAREVSVDQTRWRGGLLGWRPADSLGYGKEVVEAAKKLAVGQVSDVIESERGFHIIKIEQRSDKGLTYEEKKQDLALKAAPTYYARALARRDADRALAEAKSRPLEELFERKTRPQSIDDLPPEVLEQLMRGQGGAGGAPPMELPDQGGEEEMPAPPVAPPDEGAGGDDGKTGLIVREGPTVLAQAGGAAPPAPQTGGGPAAPAKPDAPGAKPDPAPGAKPGAPGAKPDPAPGKPAGGAQAGGAPTAAPADATLPDVTVDKPGLQSVGPVARMGDYLAGIGESKQLVKDLFETLQPGKLAPEVYEVGESRGPGGGDGFVVVLLKDREKADPAKFEQSRPKILEEMTYGAREISGGEAIWGKGVEHLSAWIKQRCEASAKGGEIRMSPALFREGEDKKAQAESAGYQPCATLGEPSVAGQLGSRRLQ